MRISPINIPKIIKLSPVVSIVCLIVCGLLTADVLSIPRFSAEQGLACIDCHFSPAGGAQRNEFGHVTMSLNELTLQATKSELLESYKSPRISEAVLTGADVRFIMRDDGTTTRYQTDFYLSYQPFNEVFANLTFNGNSIDESYVMYFRESSGLFVQAGRFYPQYGLRVDDFSAFTKSETRVFHRTAREGMNIGIKTLGHRVSAAYYATGGVWSVIGNVSRASVCGEFSYLYGFSIQHAEHLANSSAAPHSKGAYVGLGWRNFAGQFEAQLVGKSNSGLTTYAGLSARIIPGFYLRGDYNFFDSDRHFASGVEENSRVSLELWPVPFVAINPGLTIYSRGGLAGEKYFDARLFVSY